MIDPQKTGQDARIKTFDFIRAAATIAVFIFHAGYLFSYPHDGFINWYRLEYFSGTVGVSAFFVLSGFLLFYQMAKKNEPMDGTKLKEYAKKRLLRILPLYYFSLFFIVLVLRHDILFSPDGWRSIVYNLIFIRGLKHADGSGGSITINPVYWSLVVEMHFYFLLPIFYYLFHKYQKISLFLAVIVLGFAYRIALLTIWAHPGMQFLRLTPANFDFFALGMLGAYLYLHRKKYFQWMGKTSIQLTTLISLVLFINFYDLDFNPTVAYIFAPALLGCIITLSILSFLANEQTLLAKTLTSSPVLFIAKISFSIYIWHAIVINKVESLSLTNPIKFALDVIGTLGVATISYYAIEAPFLKIGLKRKPETLITPMS